MDIFEKAQTKLEHIPQRDRGFAVSLMEHLVVLTFSSMPTRACLSGIRLAIALSRFRRMKELARQMAGARFTASDGHVWRI